MRTGTRLVLAGAAASVFVAQVASVFLAQSAWGAEIDLSVTSADGVVLAGTWHTPATPGPWPAVVFTHGSEPGVRTMQGYRNWMEAFRSRGVAVLVFDKRGCGESQGTYVEAPDLDIPANDLVGWVEEVAARPDVIPSSVGVLGWSQGGWVGPLAASRSPRVAFVVAISGSGVSPLEQNIFDKTNQCRASGATEAQTLSFGRTVRAVWTYLVTGEGQDLAQREWDAVADQPWFEKAYNGPPMMERERILAHPRMTSFVEHSSFEPAPVLASVRVPMLAVFGEKDTVVPIDRSEAAMRDGFRKSGNRDLTVLHVQNADHGLRVPQADGTLALAEGYP
ncbi:MAG: alpha/beta hydrolase, partial [Candidatus Eisenbacteria bacterium]|nr:alpha/beta hydrolase [Candidatus Eisenbacteria bacterium]